MRVMERPIRVARGVGGGDSRGGEDFIIVVLFYLVFQHSR